MKKISLNFEIGFADSTIQSYFVDGNDVTVILECWNSELVEIKFLNFVSLFAMNYFCIADIQEIFESSILERALNELYDKKPDQHNLKIFRFLNSDDMTALEIVCENIRIKKIKKGYKIR